MSSSIGREFRAGETIIRQGDVGDTMFVIQEGQVEVVQREGGTEIVLGVLGSGDFFGEMAIFEKEVRSATVRARGDVRVLTVDRKTLLRRISADPSLALRMLEKMSSRLRALNIPYARMSATDRSDRVSQPGTDAQ